ncbi:hypothetical protein [Changchengzhania lutea]|uniref:hypothetical protein n=1 Tax=Changchengzhania lutea TaxID=2049305 RepID=UPI00115EB074|nr:hypothetical protein [Changchengzhania lutea]
MIANLKSSHYFFMKMFKYIIGFLFLSVLFKVSVSTENVSFSEIPIHNSVEKSHGVQSLSTMGMYLYIDTEAESLVSISHPDNLPLSCDDEISKTDGLLHRSRKLSLAYGNTLQNYNRDFFNKSFNKEIIFPFHSFW